MRDRGQRSCTYHHSFFNDARACIIEKVGAARGRGYINVGQAGQGSDMESICRSPSQHSFAEVDRLLPLSLQDLCLLEVINDVDSFPVDLLSSLPQWLRYRLLNNLPVLDLCRLEHSSVASGINRDELWDTRCKSMRIEENKASLLPWYQLNVYSLPRRTRMSQNLAKCDLERLYREVESQLKSGPEGKRLVSGRENFLSYLVSRILLSTPHLGVLTSIHGENLPLLNRHQISTEQRSYIWNKQATALAKEDKFIIRGETEISHVELLPYRLTALKRKKLSTIEQLSLLAIMTAMPSQPVPTFTSTRWRRSSFTPLSREDSLRKTARNCQLVAFQT